MNAKCIRMFIDTVHDLILDIGDRWKPKGNINFILLSLLFAMNLVAKTDIHESQLTKITENGWSENNKTLNRKIIDYAKTEMPHILQNLDKPLLSTKKEGEVFSVPKFKLARDDYLMLMAYTKYLEANHRKGEAANIYIKSLEGISNISDTSMIAAIYRMVISNIVTKSIYQAIKENAFTVKDKKHLYERLRKVLILDNTYILDAVRSEKKINSQLINQMKAEKFNDKYLQIYKLEFQKVNSAYWDTLLNAIKKKTLFETKTFEEKKFSKLFFWNSLKLFLLNKKIELYNSLSIPLSQKDYISHARYNAIKTLLVTRPRLYETCQDYLDMVSSNKKLLLKLNPKAKSR